MEDFELTYTDGWHGQESDGYYPFRWMKKEASLLIKKLRISGKKYLRVTAGHSFQTGQSPVLEVFANKKKIGEKRIEPAFSSYTFSFEEERDFAFDFKLDKTFKVPGDTRELGIMVREIEILTPSQMDPYLEGWYPLEYQTPSRSFRWMKQEARCLFVGFSGSGETILKIEAAHPFLGETNPILTVRMGGETKGEVEIFPEDKTFLIPLGNPSAFFEVELKLDKTFRPNLPGDTRSLGIMVRNIEILNLEEQEEPLYGNGWYEWEFDEFFPFHWMPDRAEIFLPPKKIKAFKYITFPAFSEYANFSQILTLASREKTLAEIPLLNKWNFYSVFLQDSITGDLEKSNKESEGTPGNRKGPGAQDGLRLTLSVNKLFPQKYHSTDLRKLGIRFGHLEFSNDDEQHQNFLFFYQNALLNHKEMKEGKIQLESFPLNLGIDLYARCNIKPHCVYCLWDRMKELEGDQADVVVDDRTLESYGPFFRSARTLVNCSFGEPLLHPRFQEILDFCARNKKIVEISTNGQAFTRRTIKALAGKPIYLYVSLDAATKETYAKIRNDQWDSIIPNLVHLNEERKKKGKLPKIYMVFIPMRVNRGDLEEYFRLCQKIEADSLVLRPLLYLWNPQIREERGGYHFDYEKEMLSQEEIEDVFLKCDEYSAKYRVPVANQFNFGIMQEPGSKRKGELKP